MVQYIAPIMVIGAGEVLMLVLARWATGGVYLTSPWFTFWFWKAGVHLALHRHRFGALTAWAVKRLLASLAGAV